MASWRIEISCAAVGNDWFDSAVLAPTAPYLLNSFKVSFVERAVAEYEGRGSAFMRAHIIGSRSTNPPPRLPK